MNWVKEHKRIALFSITAFLAVFILIVACKEVGKYKEKSKNQAVEMKSQLEEQRSGLSEQQAKIDELQNSKNEQQTKIDELQQASEKNQGSNTSSDATTNKCEKEIKIKEIEIKNQQDLVHKNSELLSERKSDDYIDDCCEKQNNNPDCESNCKEDVDELESLVKKQKKELESRQKKLETFKAGNC